MIILDFSELEKHMETCNVCSIIKDTYCSEGKRIIKPIQEKLLASGLFKPVSDSEKSHSE